MYTTSDLRRALADPLLVAIEINRLYHGGTRMRSHSPHNDAGVDVPNADWDNLIILDACRYDIFREMAQDLPGELTSVESKGSATNQFLKANFSDEDMTDTIYLTANPNLYKTEHGVNDAEPIGAEFHDEIHVWQDGWHEEHRTVMPEVVTDAALEAAAQYPNKRLLIHYLQPHAPYVGPTGIESLPTSYLNFWGNLREGEFDVSMETVKQAYRENLELVLPHARKLMTSLVGKTVITSDHGELFGERDSPVPIRRYGHPGNNVHIPALVTVPWLVYQNSDRRDTIAESSVSGTNQDIQSVDEVTQRLEDLGYAQ